MLAEAPVEFVGRRRRRAWLAATGPSARWPPAHAFVFGGFGRALRPARRASPSESGRWRRASCGVVAEQQLADRFIGVDVAGEPAEGVEARRQFHRAVERDAAMRGAQADQPAEAGRRADRAAGVGADGDVGKPAGDRRGRTGRRAAGDAVGCGRVDRERKMRILPHQREGKFVGLGLAGESRARRRAVICTEARFSRRLALRRTSAGCRSRYDSRRRRRYP